MEVRWKRLEWFLTCFRQLSIGRKPFQMSMLLMRPSPDKLPFTDTINKCSICIFHRAPQLFIDSVNLSAPKCWMPFGARARGAYGWVWMITNWTIPCRNKLCDSCSFAVDVCNGAGLNCNERSLIRSWIILMSLHRFIDRKDGERILKLNLLVRKTADERSNIKKPWWELICRPPSSVSRHANSEESFRRREWWKIIGKLRLSICNPTPSSRLVSFSLENWLVIEKLARKLLNNNLNICGGGELRADAAYFSWANYSKLRISAEILNLVVFNRKPFEAVEFPPTL